MATQGGTQPSPARQASLRTSFTVARKGFDQGEVVSYLRSIEAELRRLQSELEAARAREAELESSVADLSRRETPAAPGDIPLDEAAVAAAVGEEMANVIRTARAVAEDLRTRAQADADAALSAARTEAETTIDRARREADQTLTSAREETRQRLASSRDEADRRLEEARAEADRLVQTAEAEAERTKEEAGLLHRSRLDEADRKLAEATAEAERHGAELRARYAAEAEQLLARAAADATAMRAEADRERRLTVEGAQQARERVLGDLARRRRVATVQIEQLRAGRERLLVSYAIVRRTLEEVSEEFQKADAEARAAAEEVGRRLAAELEIDPDATAAHPGEAGGDAAAGGGGALSVTDAGEGSAGEGSAGEGSAGEGAGAGGAEGEGSGEAGSPPGPDAVAGGGSDIVAAGGAAGIDESVTEVPVDPNGGGAGAPATGSVSQVDSPHEEPGDVPDSESGAPGSGSGSADAGGGGGGDVPGGPPGGAGLSGPGPSSHSSPPAPGPGTSPGGWRAAGERVQPRSAVRIIRPEPGSPEGRPGDGPTMRAQPVMREAPQRSAQAAGQGGAVAVLTAEEPFPGTEEAAPTSAGVEVIEECPAGDASPAGDAGGRDAMHDRSDAVAGLFARIRESRAQAVADARRTLERQDPATDDAGTDTAGDAAAEIGSEPADDTAGDAADSFDGAPDDSDLQRLARRDESLDEVSRELVRRLKRELQDEQSELLDRMRGIGPSLTADGLLPAVDNQVGRYAGASVSHLQSAAQLGARLAAEEVEDPRPATIDVTAVGERLAAALVEPLRRRLEGLVHDLGEEDDREALTEAISAAYRDVKMHRIDGVAIDGVCGGFGRGWWEAVPEGTPLRWVASDADGACADCFDNTLAGSVPRGTAFPTGELFPPAHEGCRCMLTVDREAMAAG